MGEVVLATGFTFSARPAAIGTRQRQLSGGGWRDHHLTRAFIVPRAFLPGCGVCRMGEVAVVPCWRDWKAWSAGKEGERGERGCD